MPWETQAVRFVTASDGTEEVEWCEPEEAEAWGLYFRGSDGLARWYVDISEEARAERMCEVLNIRGLDPLRD